MGYEFISVGKVNLLKTLRDLQECLSCITGIDPTLFSKAQAYHSQKIVDRAVTLLVHPSRET